MALLLSIIGDTPVAYKKAYYNKIFDTKRYASKFLKTSPKVKQAIRNIPDYLTIDQSADLTHYNQDHTEGRSKRFWETSHKCICYLQKDHGEKNVPFATFQTVHFEPRSIRTNTDFARSTISLDTWLCKLDEDTRKPENPLGCKFSNKRDLEKIQKEKEEVKEERVMDYNWFIR